MIGTLSFIALSYVTYLKKKQDYLWDLQRTYLSARKNAFGKTSSSATFPDEIPAAGKHDEVSELSVGVELTETKQLSQTETKL